MTVLSTFGWNCLSCSIEASLIMAAVKLSGDWKQCLCHVGNVDGWVCESESYDSDIKKVHQNLSSQRPSYKSYVDLCAHNVWPWWAVEEKKRNMVDSNDSRPRLGKCFCGWHWRRHHAADFKTNSVFSCFATCKAACETLWHIASVI